jgi:Zn-dependent protease
MDINTIFQNVLIYALPVLFAITVHEAAHGYAARHFGDNTAYMLGRITLNPLKHIDPIGTIAMPLMLYLTTGLAFGYAKPVPVRFGNLRNPVRDMVWVALAGPAANLVQALVWGIVFYLLLAINVEEKFFLSMCNAGIGVNAAMFVFNLLPLPPLDGGRILVGLLPYKYASLISRVEPYGFYVLIALLLIKISHQSLLDIFWMRPLMSIVTSLIHTILLPISLLAN